MLLFSAKRVPASGRRLLRRGMVLSGLGALVLLLLLRAALPGPFATLRDFAFDTFQRQAPRAYAPAPVRVVDVDEASLGRIGQWPWSRQTLAELTERLQDLGAAAVAFDFVFPESDRTSPHRLREDLARRGITLDLPADLPDNDEAFADALARGRTVTGFALTSDGNGAVPEVKPGFAVLGEAPTAGLKNYPGATLNLPILEAAAEGNGNFALPASDARTVRALSLLSLRDGALVPSLALEALRVAQGAETIVIRATGSGTASIGALSPLVLKVGALEVPLGLDGSYPLHYTEAAPARTVPAWKVLDPASGLDPADITGRIVFIGSSAVGLSDLRPTPLNPLEPGVAIHAAAIEQMVLGGHLQRPIFAPAAELLAACLAALLVIVIVTGTPLAVAVLGTGGLGAGVLLGAFALFRDAHLLIDPVPCLLAVSCVFIATILARVVLSEREKRRLRHAFGHYLSPAMVKEIAAHPERLVLGGETREMTFLFTDLEGFTRFTESVAPPVLVRVLNLYLAAMCAIVTRHGGTIDKIVGDAVHAMFNAPLDQPDHADRAVAAALEIERFAAGFAAERAAEGLTIGITRIGVNTGEAVVGNFGGAGRFDYTAHGDAINTAARLEAANKALGTRICVAGSTASRCRTHRFRPIGTLMLRGKSEGVAAFEPLGPAVAGEAPAESAYLDAFEALKAAASDAGAKMLAFADGHPADPLAALHAGRVKAGLGGQAIALG